jgi:hypothetical protein
MKTQIFLLIIALLLAVSSALKAQDWPEEYLGLPGDNLNLYAVMNIFQNSETLEGFERELNNYDNMINNLDLNGDGYVDYIMVFNYVDGDVHHIVLRVALNESEYQDVAVFVVEKLRTGAVQIQLFGDEALYGQNYIVEPVYAETPNPGYTGNAVATQKVKTHRNVTLVTTTYYEVAAWPVITYIYMPTYVVYHSPWRWRSYPVYWHAWTPHYWHFYYGYHYNWYDHYYAYYRPWGQPRCINCRTVYYTSIRTYSPVVVVNINQGVYRHTYSRPDTRKKGEVVYAHRRSTGSNLPPGRTAVSTTEPRQGSRPAADVNTRTTRQTNEGRSSTMGRDTQTRSGSREVTSGIRERSETVSPGRSSKTREVQRQTEGRSETASPQRTVTRSTREQQQVATPSREQNVRSDRQTSRPTESRANVSTPRDRSTAPATRNVQRSAPESSRTESRNAPSVNRQENTRPASVERSQPSRSESRSSSNERSSVRSNNRSSGSEIQRSNNRKQESSGKSEHSSKSPRGR